MNKCLNLHKCAFSLGAFFLHFCNTFSWFGWWERHLILIYFFAIRGNYVQHKSLLESQHVKEEMG